MINFQFFLPPNVTTEVTATWDIGQDISLIQFLPHSHLLGKAWEIYATTSIETIPLIRINDWNFDWQSWYSPEYMIHLPAGSVVHASCIYDNTSDNPNNPNDPPEGTFWGDSTTDEMFFVPFRYVDYQDGDELIYLGDSSSLIGDVNGDEEVNILDVVILVNMILLDGEITLASDVNGDGALNVLDIVQLVNIILN